MPLAELEEAARQAGVADLDQVQLAILEPSGRISIIKRQPDLLTDSGTATSPSIL